MSNSKANPAAVNDEWVSVLKEILSTVDESKKIDDRTGVGTYRTPMFGRQMRFDLSNNHLPLVNVKRIPVRSMLAELFWFLSGSTDNNILNKMGCTIWDEWANDEGQLGPVYGAVWRGRTEYSLKDQVRDVIDGLIKRPFSRRHIITGWIPDLLPDEKRTHPENIQDGMQVLPPCHMVYQFFVTEPAVEGGPRELHCSLYQRSMDIFLGAPFNIASAAAMTHYFAALTGMKASSLVITAGDCHLYSNHLEQAKECVARYESGEYSDSVATIAFKGIPEGGIGEEMSAGWALKVLNSYLKIGEDDDLPSVVERRCLVTGYSPMSTIRADVAI